MAFTQVSGTVVDPNGFPYAGATLSARLVSIFTPRVGTNLIDAYASVKLDANGAFTMQLADNATVTPVASTWTFAVDTDNSSVPPPLGTGPQSFSVAGITITGAAQSVSAALQAAAPALTRTISSGSSSLGGVIGPSVGHVSVIDPTFVGNAVLEVISATAFDASLVLGSSLQPGAHVAVILAGTGQNSYIQMSDGTQGILGISFIEFGCVGGVRALQFDVGPAGKIGFFNTTPVIRQAPIGGTGGNSALASLVAALGLTSGSGLVDQTGIFDGQNATIDVAINPDAGNVIITKGSACLMTLAVPTNPAQNYKVLRIVSASAFAHVITGPAAGFNAGGAGADVATFTTAAIGDGLTLMAFAGVWYILATRGTITLS